MVAAGPLDPSHSLTHSHTYRVVQKESCQSSDAKIHYVAIFQPAVPRTLPDLFCTALYVARRQ